LGLPSEKNLPGYRETFHVRDLVWVPLMMVILGQTGAKMFEVDVP
jgi:hypothetical protein